MAINSFYKTNSSIWHNEEQISSETIVPIQKKYIF